MIPEPLEGVLVIGYFIATFRTLFVILEGAYREPWREVMAWWLLWPVLLPLYALIGAGSILLNAGRRQR